MQTSEKPIREPDEIRKDCARKLGSVEISGMFSAILGCLLGEDWSDPRIEELRISPDRCLLARVAGEASFKAFLGAEADLIRNIHGVAAVAELDGDEVCYGLRRQGAVKQIKAAAREFAADDPGLNDRPCVQVRGQDSRSKIFGQVCLVRRLARRAGIPTMAVAGNKATWRF